MTNSDLEKKIMQETTSVGYSYARLDLAKILLGMKQEEEWSDETLEEISDRFEHVFEIRQASGYSLPIEIVKP